ncbi:E3 ubiquitin-protein ligase RNF123 [Liparis tanakae]|uniref:E3 ubiquitin-protein ligase RNF123 n=1 Tax=Liparis tanakae TaxID=230148 RepID=A0A4Z2GWA5_9TELE|nr:E3 ubiquitin-protein ligase RNF123 [Liparis tanakae]
MEQSSPQWDDEHICSPNNVQHPTQQCNTALQKQSALIRRDAAAASRRLMRHMAELLSVDKEMAASFLNSVLNQLNWAFSEFIGMIQEGTFETVLHFLSQIQQAAERPERNFVDTRQLKWLGNVLLGNAACMNGAAVPHLSATEDHKHTSTAAGGHFVFVDATRSRQNAVKTPRGSPPGSRTGSVEEARFCRGGSVLLRRLGSVEEARFRL